MKRNKYTVEYGDIDIHEGVTAFWAKFAGLIIASMIVASLFI